MKIQLKNVRLAFPDIFEAKSVNGGDPRFGATFLLPKDHPQTQEITKAIRGVAAEKWGAKADAMLTQMKAGQKLCFRDGDTKAEYDGFEGHNFISAGSKVRPLVLDVDKTPLTAADGRPYGGCFVNAVVEIWPMDNSYGKRINAQLKGVQFLRDGDAFGGGAPASADEFDDLSSGADAGDVGATGTDGGLV